ncbi:GNAT family N-acetyltransferase [uncultured Limosilactobacillus sp.]|uniref:GNAT family N-acetyltransferase n=1 Tax=uncultured Limosilactobacillus sp. TaxID=2837629 RepID=UPI0025DD32EA|nr:GNAT family N-acetyltransferase [uncultured Limosilactobacillus sp.]
MAQISIRRSTSNDLDAIMQIVDQAKALLKADGSPQWQDGHPDRAMFAADITKQDNWVLMVGNEIAGTATLQGGLEPSYEKIDGAWNQPAAPYMTIHRVALSAAFRGQHLSNYFLSNLLTVGQLQGVKNFRIDTHPVNKRLQALATKFGFVKRGIIMVDDQNDPRRLAFELNLSD